MFGNNYWRYKDFPCQTNFIYNLFNEERKPTKSTAKIQVAKHKIIKRTNGQSHFEKKREHAKTYVFIFRSKTEREMDKTIYRLYAYLSKESH